MKKNSRGYHQAARGSHRVFVAECPLSGIFSMNNGSNLERYFNGVRVRSFVLTGAPLIFTKFAVLVSARSRGPRDFRRKGNAGDGEIARSTRGAPRLAPANCHDSLFLPLNALSQR
jgi:hypothetical protein